MREFEGRNTINSPIRESEPMSKAVLVMDMPEKCAWCPLGRLFGTAGATECRATERVNRDCKSVPDWCPIRPMPEKQEILPTNEYQFGLLGRGFASGWNACIDAIMGDIN